MTLKLNTYRVRYLDRQELVFKEEDVKEAVLNLLNKMSENEFEDHEDYNYVTYQIKKIFGDFER